MGRARMALLLWAIVGSMVPAAVLGQARADAATEAALIDNERRLVQAVARGDQATFRTHMADDATWASGTGFVPAAMFAESLAQANVATTDLVNPQVLWVDPTTAIVAYSRAGSASSPASPNVISSTVWTRRGDKWVAVYHQESAAPRP